MSNISLHQSPAHLKYSSYRPSRHKLNTKYFKLLYYQEFFLDGTREPTDYILPNDYLTFHSISTAYLFIEDKEKP